MHNSLCVPYPPHWGQIDCSSLTYLKTMVTTNRRIQRWSLVLQEYRFNPIHRAGSKHLDDDTLSRFPPDLSINAILEEDNTSIIDSPAFLIKSQTYDSDTRAIIDLLMRSPDDMPNFRLRSGILQHQNLEGVWISVIPRSLRTNVMTLNNISP